MKTFYSYFRCGNLVGIGAAQAGLRDIGGVECDPKIARVCDLNFPDAPTTVADVCAVDPALLLDEAPDVFHASPSCKNASQANQPDAGGVRETEQDRDAARAVARFIRHWMPPAVTIENVWLYRTFDAFGFICQVLQDCGYSFAFWHLNAADYGVPQTRKRLILIARRGVWRIQRPPPTHRKGGDMFHEKWVGWYSAIADLIDTLPLTEPAPWQLARLPKELCETMLFAQNDSQDQHGNSYGATGRAADDPALTIGTNSAGWWKAYLVGSGGYDGQVVRREEDEPSFTMTDGSNSQQIRALLLGDQSAGHGVGELDADACTPAFTLRASDHNGFPRAYIVSAGSDGHRDLVPVRRDDAPVMTVTNNAEGRMRAYLLDGDNARADTGERFARIGTEPAMTLRGSRTTTQRAYVGRWVRLTVRALGRFQTVPDSYIGLTPEINGNGIPCEEARHIMESLL